VHRDLELPREGAGGAYASAAVLFETLSALAEGQRIDIVERGILRWYAPKKSSGTMLAVAPKPRRNDATKHLAWSWHLRSSPAQLWPSVADTDRRRGDRARAGAVRDEPRPLGSVKRTGERNVLGLNVTWREHPLECVREHSVFRPPAEGFDPVLVEKLARHLLGGQRRGLR